MDDVLEGNGDEECGMVTESGARENGNEDLPAETGNEAVG